MNICVDAKIKVVYGEYITKIGIFLEVQLRFN